MTHTGRITIPERTPEPQARATMFAARPICDECKKPVEKLEDSTAVLFFHSGGVWKLFRNDGCASKAMFSVGPNGRPPRGISLRAYGRRFR